MTGEKDDKVVLFPGLTRLDIPPSRILEQVAGLDMMGLVVIGYDGDGEFRFVSSYADGGEIAWLLQRATYKLMKIGEGNDE